MNSILFDQSIGDARSATKFFDIFSKFQNHGNFNGINYFSNNRENLDWDVRIIDEWIGFWCECGQHIAIPWEEQV